MGYVEHIRTLVGHEPIILVGVTVVVLNDNREVLLQKKTSGVWSLPGGLMELGESAEETGRREVLEETGIHIGHVSLVGVFSGSKHFVELENGDQFYAVTIAYICNDIIGGELQADGVEGTEVKFFPLHEIPEAFNPEIKSMLINHLSKKL